MSDEIPFWVKFDGVKIPKYAVVGGNYKNEKVFVGRALHNGALMPGTVIDSEKVCIVPWGYSSHKKHNFEILVSKSEVNWVVDSDGNAPKNAFAAGHTEHGEVTYIGRIKHEGSVIIGKIHKLYSIAYFPYEGKEVERSEYEVLVI